eukprot:11078_1
MSTINHKPGEPIYPTVSTQTTQSPKQLHLVHRLPSTSPYREDEILYHDEMNIVFEMKPHNIGVPAEYAERLLNLLKSKWGIILCVILAVLDNTLDGIFMTESSRGWLAVVMVGIDLMLTCVLIVLLLSVNIAAWKNILKTFEFWFKFTYIILQDALELYTYVEWSLADYTQITNATLVIVLFSVCDGIPTKRRWIPAFAAVLAAVNYMYYSIQFQLFPQENVRDIFYITDDVYFSSVNALASIYRMQGVFLAKQGFNIVFRPGHATMFSFKPILRWKAKEKQQTKRSLVLAMDTSKEKSEGHIVCSNGSRESGAHQ